MKWSSSTQHPELGSANDVLYGIFRNLADAERQNVQARIITSSSKECMKTDVRESAKTWKSSELHVRKNDDDIYDWSHHDTLAEDTSDDEENLQMEPVERNSKREVRDYVVVEICGVEPKGSQYRVKWENYNNKKRGEVMKLESVLNSSQLITEYLLSASGITRMNTIKKMFNAAASVKTQKSQLISSFSYKSWAEQVKNHTLPHKYIHRVVLLQLQQSGCRSHQAQHGGTEQILLQPLLHFTHV